MKVLYLCNIPSPYRVAFFNELSKLVELTVIYERDSASDRNDEWTQQINDNYESIFLKGKKVGSETAFSMSVLKYLNKDMFDLTVIGGYATPTSMLAIMVLKLKGLNYILNADGGFIKQDLNIKKSVKSFFIKNASAWLSSGKAATDYFIHYGAKEERIFEYPFTSLSKKDIISKFPSQEDKERAKRDLNITEDKIALSIGQFIERKGFDILLKSWEGMSYEFGLYIIGDKPIDYYKDLIRGYHLRNVYFIDFLDKQTLKKYYLAADLFVLPTREDIWGLVIGEAMANGLPVITTDNCNAGLELVDSENGFVTKVEDIFETRRIIKKILSDEKLQTFMGKNSLNRIEGYTIENMAKCHAKIFNILIKK